MDKIITTDKVREVCLNKATFDIAKFLPFITPAELSFVKPFLGKELYDEIQAQYLADELTDLNQELVDRLTPAIAWKVLEMALPYMHTDITNGGLKLNNSEFANSGTDRSRADLIQGAQQMADIFLQEAKEYLEDEDIIDSYPLYEADGNIDNDTKLLGGMILDDND